MRKPGSGRPVRLMTDAKVKAFRELVANGEEVKNAALKYGISYSYAIEILHGNRRPVLDRRGFVPTRYVYAGKGQPPKIDIEGTHE